MARVRRATVCDADAVGQVHVAAWRAGYRGLLPDQYLDSLDPSTRAARWREVLGAKNEPHDERAATTLVVEDDQGRIVGIASVGHERAGNDLGVGALWMLNLAPEAWGRGIGALLLQAAEDELRGRGFSEAVLWVLDRNARARRFYERAGWNLDGAQKEDDARGFPVRELRYRRRPEIQSTGRITQLRMSGMDLRRPVSDDRRRRAYGLAVRHYATRIGEDRRLSVLGLLLPGVARILTWFCPSLVIGAVLDTFQGGVRPTLGSSSAIPSAPRRWNEATQWLP